MILCADSLYPLDPWRSIAAQQPAISAPGREPAIVGLAYTPPGQSLKVSKRESYSHAVVLIAS